MWCEGSPIQVEPDATDPLQSYAIGRDWLERVVDAADAKGCSGTDYTVSTEFDALRFFWDMTKTTGEEGVGIGGAIRPEDLADMYVDTCASNWTPNGWHTTPISPVWRLGESATFHGLDQ